MAAFYSDPNKDYLSQWSNYLQNSSYVEDVTVALAYQSKQIQNNVSSASRAQSEIIQESINAVCGTLESGFELLYGGLQDISLELGEIRGEIESMASMLDWKLSLLIEQQRISNMLTGNIAVLLRIPDIQKERQDYIETGLRHFKNARFDADLFVNSRKYLLKALEIVREDFFVLHRLGMVYMYSPKLLDLKKAEDYFKRAVKYAVAEARNESEISPNYLRADINKSFGEQITSIDSVKLQAAESYLFLSRCCYIQRRFDESVEYAGKAFDLVPQMLEARFMQAKALSAGNNEIEAGLILEHLIQIDRSISLKALADLDLSSKLQIRNTLDKIRLRVFNDATDKLNKCKANIQPNSRAFSLIKQIEILLAQKSILSCSEAIDLLNQKNKYLFNERIKINANHKFELSPLNLTFNFTLEEVIIYENRVSDIKDIFSKEREIRTIEENIISEDASLKSLSVILKKETTLKNKSITYLERHLLLIIVGMGVLIQNDTIYKLLGGATISIGLILGIIFIYRKIGNEKRYINLSHQKKTKEIGIKHLINKKKNIEKEISILNNRLDPIELRKMDGSIELLSMDMMAFVERGSIQIKNKQNKPIAIDSFYLGKYEVSQLFWKLIMDTNPRGHLGDDLPVVNVSWYDIQIFLKRLNELTGRNYRLPTYAEWNFAAKGGNKHNGHIYPGSDILDEVAWHRSNSNGKTHPVGNKMPNELGLYDMFGNVWECCSDNCMANTKHMCGGCFAITMGENELLNTRIPNSGGFGLNSGSEFYGFRLAHDA